MAYVYRRPWVRYRRKRYTAGTTVVTPGIVLRQLRNLRKVTRPKPRWRYYLHRKLIVTVPSVERVVNRFLRLRQVRRPPVRRYWQYRYKRYLSVPSTDWLLNRYKKLRGLKRNPWRWRYFKRPVLKVTTSPVFSTIIHNLPFFSTMGMFKSF